MNRETMAKFTLKDPPVTATAAEPDEKKPRRKRGLDIWLIVMVVVLLVLLFLGQAWVNRRIEGGGRRG